LKLFSDYLCLWLSGVALPRRNPGFVSIILRSD